jgi:dTMP kinase
MAKLIVLEGADGSGKSTQVELLKKYFEGRGLTVVHFHFPMYNHNIFSDIIARFLRGELGNIDEVSPYFVANIYAMDRFMFLTELKLAMDFNQVVLLDRYVYSNVAYQCAKVNLLEAPLLKKWILDFEFEFLKLPYPDLNIFFDVPSEISEKRIKEARIGDDRKYLEGKQDIHEADLEFQKRVRENYLSSMEGSPNCKIVKCAVQLGTSGENFFVFPPEVLLELYKPVIDYTLFGTPIK